MTGSEFVARVKVRLNRLDSNSYSDILPEEILFFGSDALKKLTVRLYRGQIDAKTPPEGIALYLASVDAVTPEVLLVENKVAIPSDFLLIKDMEVFVKVDQESGWVPARYLTTRTSVSKLTDPWSKSFPDNPAYELVENNIVFPISNEEFVCEKIKVEYLKKPDELTTSSIIEFPFEDELESETTTLILENLESRRLSTQPTVSKS